MGQAIVVPSLSLNPPYRTVGTAVPQPPGGTDGSAHVNVRVPEARSAFDWATVPANVPRMHADPTTPPAGPAGPAGPWDPDGPDGPATPCGPAGPWGPV